MICSAHRDELGRKETKQPGIEELNKIHSITHGHGEQTWQLIKASQ